MKPKTLHSKYCQENVAQNPETIPRGMILAVDPGSAKTGLALVSEDGRVLHAEIIFEERENFEEKLTAAASQAVVAVLGNGTHYKEYAAKLHAILPRLPLVIVDESNSTEEARELYFKLYPPTGLKKFIPLGLQSPPRPLDDLAAVVLARRYIKLGLCKNRSCETCDTNVKEMQV